MLRNTVIPWNLKPWVSGCQLKAKYRRKISWKKQRINPNNILQNWQKVLDNTRPSKISLPTWWINTTVLSTKLGHHRNKTDIFSLLLWSAAFTPLPSWYRTSKIVLAHLETLKSTRIDRTRWHLPQYPPFQACATSSHQFKVDFELQHEPMPILRGSQRDTGRSQLLGEMRKKKKRANRDPLLSRPTQCPQPVLSELRISWVTLLFLAHLTALWPLWTQRCCLVWNKSDVFPLNFER